ncbi:putative F-box domain-containing protein [Medicago truncatula]|uniref:F-box protein interaction domain protein n=1 Tax=Medicago truncatula TaxID=3880 RepID=A0A072TI83_MEDTR|nr:F-box/kelch-repeat protein At3g06240 [Medicago truncatula]KEH16628.1 F-box protein interaction domain protein [Medicago truncatula]RHN52675.1 putative F-box domain-containing protein [Medicago truncatula]
MMKSTDSFTAEKVSNHIHDDLAFFILSKLPLKSSKRFSCVRKSWSHLFENPNFINMYRKYFISSTYEEDGSSLLLQQTLPYLPNLHVLYLLFGERFENKVKFDWPPPFQEDNIAIHILGPVINGIVCLYHGREPVVILCNPATEEYQVLPPSPTESPVLYEEVYYYVHGFGYEHVRDDYKVIRYVSYSLDVPDDFEGDIDGEPIKLSRDSMWEIYNLRSNSWRKLDLDLPRAHHGWVGVYVYMKGVCHWYQDEFEHKGYLVSFDISNEVFCTTPLPLYMNDSFDSVFLLRYLMVLNDHVALISNYVEMTTFHISILGELGVKESWTKLFIIGPLPCIEHPIGEGKNGDIFFRRKDGELVRFNLSTGVIDELGLKGESGCCQIVNYKQSSLPIEQIVD